MERYSSAKDIYFMRNALNVSLRGIGNTSPNPTVGAIIVKKNKIISRGWTQPGGIPHAEVLALKNVKNLSGSTLYTTLEPCSHYGKTSPCVDKIIKSKIKRVVIGIKDPNPKVNGRGIDKLKKNKIMIKVGVLQKEIKNANPGFFQKIKNNMPYVSSKIAVSKNGKMINNKKKWITSTDSRKHGNFLRSKHDAIVTGIDTILKDNPLLNCRHYGMDKFSPARFILDSKLRIKENLKIVRTAKKIRTYLLTNTYNEKKICKLKELGVKIKLLDKNLDKINLKKAMYEISQMGFNNILIEAGPTLNYSLLKLNLLNKIYYFQSDYKINSKLLNEEKKINFNKIKNLKFKLISVKSINNDVLKIYRK